jgi:CubicO group peptidase (beta-lactamase class C family)
MRMAVCCGALVVATALRARAQDSVDPRIRRALDGLRPSVAVRGQPILRWTLEARMAELHVPGVSIAIIDSGRVIWAGGLGVGETGNVDPVTTNTLFQAQSISKAVAVTAMLALVDAGVLTLDTDVNTYLKSWKVPKNRFTDSASVTLRRIASHRAGITPASFPGYMPGSSLPTLVQILEGKSPANTPAIRVDTFPGAVEQYSGGGLLVLQQALIDATGEPFPALSKRLVFDKLGMRSSTFEEPLSSAWAGRAAAGHGLNGAPIPGKWHVFPEMAAGGLWSTPTDLARWAVDIAAAWNGVTNRVISQKLAREMLTEQKASVGLGVFLEGKGSSFAFGHSGSTRGYRADLVMFPSTGKGAVVMTNADQGAQLTSELMRSLAAEFNWPGRLQTERVAVSLPPTDDDGLTGTYDAPPLPDGTPAVITVWSDSGKLYFAFPPFNSKLELYPESRDTFFTLSDFDVVFSRDSLDRARSVLLAGQVTGKRRP